MAVANHCVKCQNPINPFRAPGRNAHRITNGEIIMDIGELLAFGVKNGASDLHLSAGLPPMIRVKSE